MEVLTKSRVLSLYYDRIASIYDATRPLPQPVSEQVTDCILRLVKATPETKFLEPGIGTGRPYQLYKGDILHRR